MALDPTPPIESRPMTTKQARRKWQKKGCPTISSAEQRRLKRAAELDGRAQAIHEKEQRQKDNARKRREKDERDKERRKRIGVEEVVKLPEGQLGLGQFFRNRIIRPEPTAAFDRAIPDGPEESTQHDDVDSDASDDDLGAADALEFESTRTRPIDQQSDIVADLHEAEPSNLPKPVSNTEQEVPPTINRPELPRPSCNKRQHDGALLRCAHDSAKRRSLQRSPLGQIDGNAVSRYDRSPKFPSGENNQRPTVSIPLSENRTTNEISKSAPGSRHQTPENTGFTKGVISCPSTAIQRFPSESIGQRPVDEGNKTRPPILRRQNDSPIHAPLSSQTRKPHIESPEKRFLKPATSGEWESFSSQHKQGHTFISSQYHLPVLDDCVPTGIGEEIPQTTSSKSELRMQGRDNQASLQPKQLISLTESFGGGISDDDLLNMNLTDELVDVDVLNQRRVSAEDHTDRTLPQIQPDLSAQPASTKAQLSRSVSSQTFACEFSSQELAFLYSDSNLSSESKHDNILRMDANLVRDNPSSEHSRPIQVHESALNLVSFDGFEFPGCTQDLVTLLAEEDNIKASAESELQIRQTEMIAYTERTTKKSDHLPTQTNPNKKPMLPPLRPVETPAPTVQDDEFDCFRGSTQALLDLF